MLSHRVVGLKSKRTPTTDSIELIAQQLLAPSKRPRVTVLLGAGVSVAAGIPDYRSPGGMYETLRPELLTASEDERDMMRDDPTNVVSLTLFEQNQLPFLELLRPVILGVAEKRWQPVLAHRFLQVLHEKGLIEQVFTCNVDGLDHQLDLPVGKILAVHGTVAHVRCEFCKHKMPADEFRALMRSNIKDISASDSDAPAESKVIRCPNAKCGRAGMKPTAVLFGAKLDAAVAKRMRKHMPRTDLLFVVGTSLSVKPISSIPEQCPLDAVRIVVNRDPPSSGFAFGSGRDHLLQGECDEMFVALAARLGWLPDLARFRDEWPQASKDLFDEALAETESAT